MNHFRHCPKHKKPLPCPHCVIAAPAAPPVLPAPSAPVAAPDPALACEYRRDGDVWTCTYCGRVVAESDMTADGPVARACTNKIADKADREAAMERQAEKDKRAKAARERRKKNADELKAIKEALATPLEIRLAQAKELIEQEAAAEKERLGLKKSQSIFTVSGGYDAEKLATITGLRETDTGRVTPEGVGGHQLKYDLPDAMGLDPWGGHAADEAGENNLPIIPGGGFPVKLNDVDPKTHPAFQIIPHYFIEMLPLRYQIHCTKCGAVQGDEETVAEDYFTCGRCGAEHGGLEPIYICRLCDAWCEGQRGAASHMLSVHGKENEPRHDKRFGDVLNRWLRGGKKAPDIGKALKKAEKSVTP